MTGEAILIGREGFIGSIVSGGYLPAYSRVVVKLGGPFAWLSVEKLDAAKLQSPTLRDAFARYATCLLAQLLQSTACNARSSSERPNGSARRWSASAATSCLSRTRPVVPTRINAQCTPGAGKASARTNALVSQPETGKRGYVRHPCYGRLSPGVLS